METEHRKYLPHVAIVNTRRVTLLDQRRRAMYQLEGEHVRAMTANEIPVADAIRRGEAFHIVATERSKVLVRWFAAEKAGSATTGAYLLPAYAINKIPYVPKVRAAE